MNGEIEMKNKILSFIICLFLLTTLLLSFGVNAAPAPIEDELYIGVYCLGNLEYFYDHKIGLKAAGEMMGVKTKYVGPPDYDINAMVTAFEAAIAEKPAGIITFGAEDSLLPVINKAIDQGIPVVTVDGDIKNSKRVAFVGTGNYNAGFLGGTKLGEALNGKGKVAILTEPISAYIEIDIKDMKMPYLISLILKLFKLVIQKQTLYLQYK
jgi:ribose transport system substrate-binding protein